MRATDRSALALLQAAVPLVPMGGRWIVCTGCGFLTDPYDGQDVCPGCVMESFALDG